MYDQFLKNSYVKTSLSVARQRVAIGIAIFSAIFLVLAIRLIQVMVFDAEQFCKQHNESFRQLNIFRADILDRNGQLIATSLPTVSAYAKIKEIQNIQEAAEKIIDVFPEINKSDLIKKFSSDKKFIWIKRHLSPVQEQKLLNLGIPGIEFLKTERRVYPDSSLVSHVVGFTDIDNCGISGIEKSFDDVLKFSKNPVQLSIDLRIQHAVRQELLAGIQEFSAKGAACIVMKMDTGEILSMVCLPDFDPNIVTNPSNKANFNFATSAAIEPGSSGKIINTALAIKNGISTHKKFDARFPLAVGRFRINDFKGKGTFLSVAEILKFSSNIGSAKIALEIGPSIQKEFFKELGLLSQMKFELLEVQQPLFQKKWTEVTTMTISYGHGIAFSPLHLIMAVSGILNNGIMQNPTLLKVTNLPKGKRVVSEKVSKQLQYLLRLNVLEGTNKKAEVKGYFVGGKSGTSEKIKGKSYQKNANYTSFIGSFPMGAPRYAVYILLDEPQATEYTFGFKTAGWNAVPLSAKIIAKIIAILGIVPYRNAEPNWNDMLE